MSDSSDRPNPLDAGRRRRGPECVSHLAFDRLALGELDAEEQGTLCAQLAGCADCAAARARLCEDRDLCRERCHCDAFAHNTALDRVLTLLTPKEAPNDG